MVVCGLKVTVLCGLGGLELDGAGGGRSGDVSVGGEAIAGTSYCFWRVLEVDDPKPRHSFEFLSKVDQVSSHSESANIIAIRIQDDRMSRIPPISPCLANRLH